MEELRCQIPEAHPVTVGEIFWLECAPVTNLSQNFRAHFILKDEFLLQVARVENGPDHLRLAVRSDLVGQQKIENPTLEISDGATPRSFHLPDLQFTVQTSQNQTEPVKEPFGPFGPLKLAPPWGLVLIGILLLLAVIAGLLFARRQKRKRRKYLAELEKSAAGAEPLTQFYRQLRTVDLDLRKLDTTAAHAKMREAFEIFLQRKFAQILSKKNQKKFFQQNGISKYFWMLERLEVPTLSAPELTELREALLLNSEKIHGVQK